MFGVLSQRGAASQHVPRDASTVVLVKKAIDEHVARQVTDGEGGAIVRAGRGSENNLKAAEHRRQVLIVELAADLFTLRVFEQYPRLPARRAAPHCRPIELRL